MNADQLLPAAVLWDMDGTLLDTERYWIEAEYNLVAEHGGSWNDHHCHAVVGMDLRDSARYIQTHGGVDLPVDVLVNQLLDRVLASLHSNSDAAALWMPGARDLLGQLRAVGVPCALVTMSWRRLADEVVALLPQGTFDAVIVGDEVTMGKPHPEPYLNAAGALGVVATRCVAIEDSPTGLRSAEAAGCASVAVPNLVPIAALPGRTVLTSLVGVTAQWLGTLVTQRTAARWPGPLDT